MKISSNGSALASQREEVGLGARRQMNLIQVPSRSASNTTNPENLVIHIAMVHPSTRHSSCHPHIFPSNTHTLSKSPQQPTWVFQAEFCNSEEVRLPQEQRTKEMLKTGKHFYQAAWNVVCSSPICWKHWKAFPNISNICWVGQMPPPFRSTHHLWIHQASY